MNDTGWMHGLIDRLRETQHEQVRLLNHIVGQQTKIIKLLELAANQRPASTRSTKSAPSSPKIAGAVIQWLVAILTAIYIFQGGDIGTALKALSLISG